jgi:hypothetical protein
MGKSRNKGRSEVETLRGEIRQLKKELKYYRRRAHIETTIIDEAPIERVFTAQCPECKSGVLISYDFKYVILDKCSECEYQIKKKK